jgi:hypothetical protein
MVCLDLATPVAQTGDAGGGALRSWRREWPETDYLASLGGGAGDCGLAIRKLSCRDAS